MVFRFTKVITFINSRKTQLCLLNLPILSIVTMFLNFALAVVLLVFMLILFALSIIYTSTKFNQKCVKLLKKTSNLTVLKDLKLSDLPKPVDVVLCNPPYFKVDNKSKINEKREIAISRHEIEATLDDIVSKASELLKDKGRLYMVHLASRSAELVSVCSKNKLEVKRMKFIFNGDKEAYLVLIEAVKNGNPGVRITKNKEN